MLEFADQEFKYVIGFSNTIQAYFTKIEQKPESYAKFYKDILLYYSSIQGKGWTDIGIIATIDQFIIDVVDEFIEISYPEIIIHTYQPFIPDDDLLIDIELMELKNSNVRVFFGLISDNWEAFFDKVNEFDLIGENYVWFAAPGLPGYPFPQSSELSRGIISLTENYDNNSPQVQLFQKYWKTADKSIYPLAGENTTPSVLNYQVFDMVMTVARTLSFVEERFGFLSNNISSISPSICNQVIRNVTFDGLSGSISFDNNGNRIGQLASQFYYPENNTWIKSGIWAENDGYQVINDVIWYSNTNKIPDLDIREPFYYWSCFEKEKKYDPTGKTIELHTPDGNDIDDIDYDYHCDHFIDCKNLSDESYNCSSNFTILFIVFGVITGLLICFAFLLIIFVLIFGIFLKYKRLKKRSPTFLIILLLSIIIGFSSIFAWMGKPHPVACGFQPWLLGIPTISMITILSVKNFRVWRIFRYPLKRVKVTDFELIIYWFLLLLPGIFILILWSIISTPTATLSYEHNNYHYVCDTGGFTGYPGGYIFFSIFIAYCIVILLFGCIISIIARNVPTQFNETRLLTISIYNLAFLAVVIIPVYLVVEPFNPFIAWIIRSIAILYGFATTLCIQFLPALFGIFIVDKGKNLAPTLNEMILTDTSSGNPVNTSSM